MAASLPRFPANGPTERIVDGLREHGAVIVEGLLTPDVLARFNAEIEPILAQVSPKREYLNPAIDFFYGDRVRQITGVAARSRVFGEEILCHPFYDGVCAAILGPSCASWQLNVAQVMDRGPGAEQQFLARQRLKRGGRWLRFSVGDHSAEQLAPLLQCCSQLGGLPMQTIGFPGGLLGARLHFRQAGGLLV